MRKLVIFLSLLLLFTVAFSHSKASSIITTIAGTYASQGYSGDANLAINAQLNNPYGVAVDNLGNVYIADKSNCVIRKVSATDGKISTVAGIAGVNGYSGDGGQATSAKLNFPFGIAVDNVGNLYIADTYNHVIRKVSASGGIITTVVGTAGVFSYSGDGGPAISATLSHPSGVALDMLETFISQTQ